MNITATKRVALLSLFLAPVSLFAFTEVAKGDLWVKGTARGEYDSNIYANNKQIEDYVFTATPELGFTREAGWLRFDANTGVNIQRFSDYTDENSENPFGQLYLGWNKADAKSDGKFLLSAKKSSVANDAVNQRTVSNDYIFDANVGHFATEKLGYRVKANYTTNNYQTTGMHDLRKLMGGVEGRYQYSPKLEVFVGYALRENTIFHRANNAADIKSTDNQFSVGTEGELAPKVKGRVAVGLVTRDYRHNAGDDQAGLLLDSSVTWKYTELGSVKVFLNDDFDNSPVDQSIRRLSTGFDVTHAVSPKLDFGGGITFAHESYSGVVGLNRTDDSIVAQVRASYKFSPYVTGAVYVSYRNADSTLVTSDYDRTNVGVSVQAKF